MTAAFVFVMRLVLLSVVAIGVLHFCMGFVLADSKSLLSGLGGMVLTPLLWRKHFDNHGTYWALLVLSVGFGSVVRALVA